jgi:streptogramin lyase
LDGAQFSCFGGDGGPAVAAQLHEPASVAVADDGSFYIADTCNNRVRRVTPDGKISTVAGSAPWFMCGHASAAFYGGDGGPATQALLEPPSAVAVGHDGSVYISDSGNHRIRRVASDGTITTVAGTGAPGFGGDGGLAPAAQVGGGSRIDDLAVGPDGTLYAADEGNNRIRAERHGTALDRAEALVLGATA